MFIDSPNFVRRAVLNSNTTSSPNQRISNPEQYEYGLERSLLAKHVSNRLNSHDQDNEILERFRKEAQDLKRQKWLSKRNPNPSSNREPDHIKSHSQNSLKINQEPSIPSFKPVTSVLLRQDPPPSKQVPQRNKGTQIVNHYERLLKSKDTQLKKKDRKLKKSRQVIEKMQFKIKNLQQEKEFVKREEELEVQKINALIEEMNYKIATNRALFQEELAKLKIPKTQTSSAKTTIANLEVDAYQYAPKIKRKQSSLIRHQPEGLTTTPSIFYQLPKVTKEPLPSLAQLPLNSNKYLPRRPPEDENSCCLQ